MTNTYNPKDRPMRDTFKDMRTVNLPFEGEKDISRAHARRRVVADELEQCKRELAAIDEWLAVTMPTELVDTDYGTLRRKFRTTYRGWRQDEWRKDALRASLRHDAMMRRLADPDTGEVEEVPNFAYVAGWEAANRLVTLAGNLAKTGGKKLLYTHGLAYDDEYAESHTSAIIEEVEDER